MQIKKKILYRKKSKTSLANRQPISETVGIYEFKAFFNWQPHWQLIGNHIGNLMRFEGVHHVGQI